ncbi:XRE family transcriptional regulator [Caballeronia pedi]|uniref:XRE family transcriptional regulator n=1 Tax=Caballeronia pedi TaxID=1777141 RepID=A0A158BTX1_9BURK|nr:XRE family transcriptional regulator [Caballeronia pedi]SAK73136.1 XRE family transcriptional regulator [Caballeronia pedi]
MQDTESSLDAAAAHEDDGEVSQQGAEDRIGEDVRSLRKAKRMTLAELASRIDRSIAYLSKLERGLTRPSITELNAISAALDIKINFFFHETTARKPSERRMVVRKAERRKLNFAAGVTDFLLSPNLDGPLELLKSVFEPGAGSGDVAYSHEGDEAGVVLSGTLEFWVGDDHFTVEEGDSFSFKSSIPHRYRNPGSVEAVVIWVITPPSY